MDELYQDNACFVEPRVAENAEILAALEKIAKEFRKSRKKGRKGGKKGRKNKRKKQSKWWESALAYATPKAIDLIVEKIAKSAKPQVYIVPAESQPQLALPEKVGRK